MRPLGKHQLCLLATMASPFSLLIVGDRVSKSLVNRGLLEPHFARDDDAFHGISPAGLRAVARAMERGELEQFLDPKFQRDRARLFFGTKASASQDTDHPEPGEEG